MADILNMSGEKIDIKAPFKSRSIESVASDVIKLNNNGRLQCVLISMVMDDGTVENSFGTKGVAPISLLGSIEALKHFYLNHLFPPK